MSGISQLIADTKDITKHFFLKRFKVQKRVNAMLQCQLRDAISEPQLRVLNMRP